MKINKADNSRSSIGANEQKVYFIGAGPGAADLITVHGANLLKVADVVVYAGSLVDDEMLAYCKDDAQLIDSSALNLNEVVDILVNNSKDGKTVIRLHSGDPSIYGAIQEQIDILNQQGIGTEVVPGVSSFSAAASVLQQELTLPGVSQTVILTRMPGRTEAPEWEALKKLANENVTFCIFLSSHKLRELVSELLNAGFSKEMPVAVVARATRKGQQVYRETLESIVGLSQATEIKGTAMVIVGRVLDKKYDFSKLYDETFSHGFRK